MTWGGALLLVEASRRLARSAPVAEAAAQRPPHAGIDYRFVILGSILPDLIDKPLGVFLLREQLSNGRTIAHSLLFGLLVTLAALTRRGKVSRGLLSAALGSAAHLVLDQMWTQTDTLFWPLKGLSFQRQDISRWLQQVLEQLRSDPYTYISEAAGAVVVLALLLDLRRRHALPEFLRSGRMGSSFVRRPEPGLAAGEERPHQLQGGERPAQR